MARRKKTLHNDHHRDGISMEALPSGSWRARVWDAYERKYRSVTAERREDAQAAAEALRARFALGLDNARPATLDVIWSAYCQERFGVTAGQVQELRDAPSSGKAAAGMVPRPRVAWQTMVAAARVVDGMRMAGAVDFKAKGFRASLSRFFNSGLHLTRTAASDGRAAVSTRRRILGQVRALVNFAQGAGWLPSDPLAGFQAVGSREQNDSNREVFGIDELRALVALWRLSDPLWIHAVLCAYTGARDAEARALSWADYEQARGLLMIRRGKGGKARAVPVQPELANILAAVSDVVGPTAERPCIPSTPIARPTSGRSIARYANFEKLLTDAGIKRDRGTDPITEMPRRLHRHSLRHTYCALMLATGEPGDSVRLAMGHSTADLTQLYGAQVAGFMRQVKTEKWERGEFKLAPSSVASSAQKQSAS